MHASTTPTLESSKAVRKPASALQRMTGYAPARRLVRTFLPWISSDFLIRSGIVRLPEAKSNEEEEAFPADRPFVAGTGILGGFVPPIASGALRAGAGFASMTDYLLTSDSWLLLVTRFLKERSKVLEVGCGCGEIARTLVHHPHVARYIGIDASEANIEWCRAAIGSRAPQVFEFHRQSLPSVPPPRDPAEEAASFALPAPESAVDLIIFRRLSGPTSEPEIQRCLAELRRVLALNGLLLAAVPRKELPSTEDPELDLSRLAYLDRFQAIAASVGLETWQRMTLLDNQELFILRRTACPPAGLASDGEVEGTSEAGTSFVPPPASSERRVLTSEMLRLNKQAAAEQSVAQDVHPDDFIYWFVVTHPLLSLERAIDYYFRDGATSAAKLADLVAGFDDLDQNSIKLLEFAAGYGCVTRHLKKRRRFDLTSCDIHPQALAFLSGKLGVKTLPSSHQPAGFAAPEKFDVIFALSFFSHMPKQTFGPWLKALFQALHDPGYLIFTTLGTRACRDVGITPADIPEDGIWFEARSEQHDLDQADYGLTIVTPDFVRSEVQRQTDAQIVLLKQVGWWDNQDLWVIKRDN